MHYFPCSISTPPLSPQFPPSRLRERLPRGSRSPLPLAPQYGRSWCWTKKRRTSSLRFCGCRISARLGLRFTCMFSLSRLSFGLVTAFGKRQLHSSRPPLSDVPAIYFVAPTLANVRRIAQDLQKDIYESFHLNFSEPLPRSLLEELAAAVAKDGTNELVEQVNSHRAFLEAQANRFVVTGR